MLPLELKLTLVTISPTIITMKLHKLRFRLGLGLLTWFLFLGFSTGFSSLGFSTGFSSLAFSLPVPKNTLPKVFMNLIGFLEIVGLWRKHGWSWGCV
jgi:hypothetical protein